MLQKLDKIDKLAKGDVNKFLKLYNERIKQYITNNPILLTKEGY